MTTKHHVIPPHIQDILSRAATDGVYLILPGQLSRTDYQAAMKVIELAGGKWVRAKKCHEFPDAAALAKLTGGLEAGKIVDEKKTRQAFYTPEALADKIASTGCVVGCRVLEPSAGGGALLRSCLKAGAKFVQCVELDKPSADALVFQIATQKHPLAAVVMPADFLEVTPQQLGPQFDCVVMNPPFTRGTDAKHVLHALKFLKPGGRLVAIMAGTDLDADSRRSFREAIGRYEWETEPLPRSSFSEAGTSVNTLLLTIRL